ncbi:MAG TPA: hypothetical protein VGO24_10845 [Solirubrobacterales bacterium]|nr:hypothetical protein [Solirubrobacterales bacterium]
MNRPRRALIAIALFLVGLVACVPLASAAPGQVRVQAEVTSHESGDGFSVNGVRLQIYRDGEKILDRAPVRPCPGCILQPSPPEAPNPAARVVQLDATPEPEVVFTLYSIGAHCCVFAEVFRWDDKLGRYLVTTRNFLDSGYLLKDLRHDGHPLFAGSDNRLAYRFSCFLCSIFPPQIWEFRGGEFIDVTRSFPKQVKRDLARAKQYYRQARGKADIRGILTDLVADTCLLDRCQAGFSVVQRAAHSGFIRAFDKYEPGPHGAKFVPALRRFLRHLGYA